MYFELKVCICSDLHFNFNLGFHNLTILLEIEIFEINRA